MEVPFGLRQVDGQQNQALNWNSLNRLGVRYRAPKTPQQEQGRFDQRYLQGRNEDTVVSNLIAQNYKGVLTCAYCVRLRGEELTYSSILREINISGRHINRRSSAGHLPNVNDITEDVLGEAEADRAVLLLWQSGFTGVVQCAFQLLNRGVQVRTNTLYAEMWVTGRLQ